jgi:sulfur carrier protein ThiS
MNVDQNSQAFEGERQEAQKHAGGRPPKYYEPRRPITVTLPERILRDLHSINPDRSRAIVKCVETVTGKSSRNFKLVELIELTPGKALIVVGPSASLQQIEWLRLVEISPLRYLLVIPSGTAVEVLEVTIHDLLRDLDPNNSEIVLLKELLDVISYQRRGGTITKADLLFFDTPMKVSSQKP